MDNRIEWLNSVKYLGVLLDSKLTFTAHINSIVQKSIGLLIKLYPLLKNNYLSSANKLLIYKSIVRSCMMYACPVWSMTCKTNINKLQVTQNKFLRIIGNFRRFNEISFIHRKLDIEYVNEYILKLSRNYFNSIPSHRNPLVKSIMYNSNMSFKHKRIMHAL